MIPKISIGLPVYNGEKFLQKKIESLLKQTNKDFELIISDNASTDSTPIICQEYVLKDKRISYFRQEKNIGAIQNFRFVLEKAKADYFAWTAVDDIILPDFFEKNIRILDSRKNIVCSISQVDHYGERTESLKPRLDDSLLTRFMKKIKRHYNYIAVYSASGSYEKKLRCYLKRREGFQIFYGVYRTDALRKSMISDHITGFDWLTILNALKYGDFHVIKEILMLRYDGGDSSSGLFNYARSFNLSLLATIFPYGPFTIWCAKNLGVKLFLRNLDCFIKIGLDGVFYLGVDIVRTFIRKIR
jgi:glycosyltransferase involved in cell wall biosynthesis